MKNHYPLSFPNQISCKIDSTDISLKGQTVSSSYKPAVIKKWIKNPSSTIYRK